MQVDHERINRLVNMSLTDSQLEAGRILNECTFKNQAKRIHLINDIAKAKKSSEVCRIMWYTFLAGEKLSVVDSKWQSQYK